MSVTIALPLPHAAWWQVLLAIYLVAALVWIARGWRAWKSEAGFGPAIGIAAFVLFLGWIPFIAIIVTSPWLIKDRFFTTPPKDESIGHKEEAKVSV